VVFTPSGAVDLRKALARLGRDEEVIALVDDLSFGPIDPQNPEARHRWVESELGYSGWEDVVREAEEFWMQALSAGSVKVAWISRRTASEYAGFLAWLARLGDLPCEIVDPTDAMIGDDSDNRQVLPKRAIPLALLSSNQIVANDILNLRKELAADERSRYAEMWRKLRTENAPLRIISGDTLVSAPISFFDPLLLSHATTNWQKQALVVGKVLTTFLDNSVFQTGDLVLVARLRALARAGLLESRGDLNDIQRSEVRLPS
jgi:hypothetical protein